MWCLGGLRSVALVAALCRLEFLVKEKGERTGNQGSSLARDSPSI